MNIVAISDQHGYLPDIPPCDLLIVAGDNAFDRYNRVPASYDGGKRQKAWMLSEWLNWRRKQPAKYCVATFGNHDFCASLFGPGTHKPDDTTAFVIDDVVLVGELAVWLTPWSNRFGDWANMGSEDELVLKYAQIPQGIDIIVSHQPPRGYCDAIAGVHDDDCPLRYHHKGFGANPDSCTCGCVGHLGSAALLDAIRRVRPSAVVCGHLHGGYGKERLLLQTKADADAGLLDGGYCWVYNCSVVDEAYRLVNPATVIEGTWAQEPTT